MGKTCRVLRFLCSVLHSLAFHICSCLTSFDIKHRISWEHGEVFLLRIPSTVEFSQHVLIPMLIKKKRKIKCPASIGLLSCLKMPHQICWIQLPIVLYNLNRLIKEVIRFVSVHEKANFSRANFILATQPIIHMHLKVLSSGCGYCYYYINGHQAPSFSYLWEAEWKTTVISGLAWRQALQI